jgi:hypothetical protein
MTMASEEKRRREGGAQASVRMLLFERMVRTVQGGQDFAALARQDPPNSMATRSLVGWLSPARIPCAHTVDDWMGFGFFSTASAAGVTALL